MGTMEWMNNKIRTYILLQEGFQCYSLESHHHIRPCLVVKTLPRFSPAERTACVAYGESMTLEKFGIMHV